MASKKVNIQIDTRANTTGAKQVEVAVDKMVDSVDEAEAAVVDLSVAVDKLDTKLIDVDRSATEVERTVDKLDTTLDVAQSIEETAQSIEAVAKASDKAAVASKKQEAETSKVGQVASAAGFQLQDFAVQVAGGTSALTAMAQQAPQFLGVFGPGGAIAGALIAVGAIALKVFNGMADDSANAAEKAAFLATTIKDVSETASKAVGEDIDFGLQQIDDAADAALGLIGAFNGVTDAANAASLATLSNAEKIRKAEVEIRKLRGEQVDEIKEIEAATAAESAMREEQARQAIAAENTRVQQAKEAEAEVQKAFDLKLQEQATTQASLAAENQKLGVLRAQRDELEKQAKAKGDFSKGEIPFIGAPGAAQAQKQLDDQFFQASIALAEQNIAVLETKGKEISDQLNQNAKSLNSAMTTAAATVQQAAISIPKIAEEFKTADIVAQVDAIKEVATEAATKVQDVIDQVKPANAAEAAALEELKPMVADKKITADETLRVSQLLGTLDGAIRTQMGTAATNTQSLIDTIRNMQRTLDAQEKQINLLRSNSRGSGN